MHTVIALSERTKSSYRNWSVLFDPFIEKGILSVCDWNQHTFARTLAQAIPQLQDVIKGKGEWRVIAIDTGAQGRGSPFENPFDFVGNASDESVPSIQTNIEDSRYPVIRLAHMLLGFPELGTKHFIPDISYSDIDTGKRVYESELISRAVEGGISLEDAKLDFHTKLVTQYNVQVHYREELYSEEEVAAHRLTSDQYRVRHAHPSEVMMVTTRDPMTASPTARLRKAWGYESDLGASRFVERNNYPASCRFGVYDLHYREHAEYELDQMRFWLSVVTVASNILPPSSFQSERVYRMSVEVDHDTLGDVLNTHLGQLLAVRDYLDKQVRSPKRFVDHPLEEVLKDRIIPVSFDSLAGEGLSVSTAGYGLVADSGRSDSGRWDASFGELTAASEAFIRQPRRVLSRTVSDTRIHAQEFLTQDIELTEIEIEELKEELTKRTGRLTQPATTDILNRAKFFDMIRENNLRIRLALSSRMRAGVVVVAVMLVLAPWLAAFTPFLISAASKSRNNFLYSSLVVVGIVLLLVVATFITLFIMKYVFIRMIRRFNEQLKNFYLEVQAGASKFSKYLSELATYMFGRSVLIATANKQSNHLRTLEWLFATRKKVNDRIESEKSIQRSLNHSIEIERIQYDRSRVDDFGFSDYRKIFRLPVGNRLANLNHTGEQINAPYLFIKRLNVENLGIREMLLVNHVDKVDSAE